MALIYIVEDDVNIREIETFSLKNSGYTVMDFECAKDFYHKLSDKVPDLILLDIMLPGEDGLDILTRIRADKATADVPVIMVTAKTSELDKVKGLDLGADDYITKPFSLSVLRARVNTQLRKAAAMSEKEKDNEHVYRKEPYVFDFDRMKFMVDGKEIELSKTEQKLLRILVENAGMNMRRELLLDRVWSDGAEYVDENALSVSIKRLRDKLGAEHAIRTVYGIGYRWE